MVQFFSSWMLLSALRVDVINRLKKQFGLSEEQITACNEIDPSDKNTYTAWLCKMYAQTEANWKKSNTNDRNPNKDEDVKVSDDDFPIGVVTEVEDGDEDQLVYVRWPGQDEDRRGPGMYRYRFTAVE